MSLSHSLNRFLAAIPERERSSLTRFADTVVFNAGDIVCHPGDQIRFAYFPTKGMLSLMGTTEDGRAVQIAGIGSAGLAGVSAVLGAAETSHQVAAHIRCEALRLRSHALVTACQRYASIRQLALRWTHQHLTEVAQAALCFRFHLVEERLSSALLALANGVGQPTVSITQDALSQILGSPRSTVSCAAATLQDRRIISVRHGRVQLLDRSALERHSCGCAAALGNGGAYHQTT